MNSLIDFFNLVIYLANSYRVPAVRQALFQAPSIKNSSYYILVGVENSKQIYNISDSDKSIGRN